MRQNSVTNKDRFTFFAVIPLLEGEKEAASWSFGKKNLLRRAVDVALSIQCIERIFFIGSSIKTLFETGDCSKIQTLELEIPDLQLDMTSFNDSPSWIRIIEGICHQSGKYPDCHGLVILDPLCPFHKPHHIEEAVKLYLTQQHLHRPWLSVRSVHRVPSHYHPKKILKLSEQGGLDYFDPGGKLIYQRQQLQDDDYYCLNGVVSIVDPLETKASILGGHEMLGLILDEPMVRVEGIEQLALAEALNDHDLIVR
jgi:CMP-N-acetylneuraminic acid synthetase